MSANDRAGVGAGSGEYGTPQDLYDRLNRRFHFDYDPFASHHNAKCDLYSTIEGTFERNLSGKQSVLKDSDEDGLIYPWAGRRVFMNPPYTRGLIDRCMAKAYANTDEAEIIVALVPGSLETDWFRRYVIGACHWEPLPRRVHFIHPPFACKDGCAHALGEPLTSPPSGMVVALFRAELMP